MKIAIANAVLGEVSRSERSVRDRAVRLPDGQNEMTTE